MFQQTDLTNFEVPETAEEFTLFMDPLRLAGYKYAPTITHSGTSIIFCHGMQSHQKWFSQTAEHFQSMGHVVYSWDRPGSGESSRVEGLRGHIDSRQVFIDSLARVMAKAAQDHPRNKIVLWGNSYGAKIVGALVAQGDIHVDGLIFSTPGLFTNKQSMKRPFSFLSFLFASRYTFFPTYIPEVNEDNGAAMFTEDTVFATMIKNDDRSLRRFTKSFYLESKRLDSEIKRKCHEIPIPTMVLLVEGDTMILNQPTKLFFKDRFLNCTVKTYGDKSRKEHSLMFSSGRLSAYADLDLFLKAT